MMDDWIPPKPRAWHEVPCSKPMWVKNYAPGWKGVAVRSDDYWTCVLEVQFMPGLDAFITPDENSITTLAAAQNIIDTLFVHVRAAAYMLANHE